jgi:hypothetical protein
MFIGHFGVGFAARAAAPKASLGTMFLAAQFIDLLWPTLLLAGVEHVEVAPGITRLTPLDFVYYPVSHSLLAVLGWAVGFGLVYRLLARYPRGALIAAFAVASHWLLDLVVHRPDLPLYPGGVRVGFGLWNAPLFAIAIELAIFAAGLAWYLRATRARDRAGRLGLAALVVFLLTVYVANFVGPPPPDSATIAWAAQAQWLLIAWAYWIDRHRDRKSPVVRAPIAAS